eukprot:m.155666 g.155666  ORF g.155666 m.155666 type:complete len:64 (+) comp16968_c3_seq1:1744-1935(+)
MQTTSSSQAYAATSNPKRYTKTNRAEKHPTSDFEFHVSYSSDVLLWVQAAQAAVVVVVQESAA